MDILRLLGMKFYAYHGDYPEERKLGSGFTVNVEITGDFSRGKTGDQVENTVDLRDVYDIVQRTVSERSYHLTETLAEVIAEELLQRLAIIQAEVTVRKESPPIPGIIDAAEAVITRKR